MVLSSNRQPTASQEGSLCRYMSLVDMPLEVVLMIIDHCAVQDLATLSIVSKSLRSLLSDRGIWTRLYRSSTFLRPPGPYQWQSTSYLIKTLLRGEKLQSVWPSSLKCPKVFTRGMTPKFSDKASFSVLLGRWLLVAEGSTLLCFDSYCDNFSESAIDLHHAGANHRIQAVFSVGDVGSDGIFAVVVLVFRNSITIAKVLMDQGMPSGLETVLTTQFMIGALADLTEVRLYHRLLVINVGECSSDWESSGRLVIMDIHTMRRYHLPVSPNDTEFDPIRTKTFFLATKTHFIKVVQSELNSGFHSKLEYFPLPATPDVAQNVVLYPSHSTMVDGSLWMHERTIIHESPLDSEAGKTSFTLCGLAWDHRCDGFVLKVVDVCLERDGSVSLTELLLAGPHMTSYCVGFDPTGEHGYGVAQTHQGHILAFAIRYHEPGFITLTHCIVDRRYRTGKLLTSDCFGGIAFFKVALSGRTVELLEFGRDAHTRGRLCKNTLRNGICSVETLLDGQPRRSGR